MTELSTPQDFSINQVATEAGISTDTLRYYEKEGLLFKIRRTSSGHRRFSKADISWLNFVLCLKSTGMPLDEIRAYKELAQEGDLTLGERKKILENHREFLRQQISELKRNLKTINYKIDYYQEVESQAG